MPLKDFEIEKKVILLRLFLEEDESPNEALKVLANTKMATLKELKKFYKSLQEEGFITSEGKLTFLGIMEAKKAKKEFTLEN